jgi:uncharacterized BrkB/YihY/UPF0761 family membrane protein
VTTILLLLTAVSLFINAIGIVKVSKLQRNYGKDERWQFIQNRSNFIAIVAILVLTFTFAIFIWLPNMENLLLKADLLFFLKWYTLLTIYVLTDTKFLALLYYDKKY